MNIENPSALWFLALLIPIIASFALLYRSGRHDIGRFVSRIPQEIEVVYLVKWFFSSLFFVLCWAFLALALADISWGQSPLREERSGGELVAVVDVSRSMRATDIEPSRIARARELLGALIRQLPDYRFALVIFAGQATQLLPMTEDNVIFEPILASLTRELITTAGTNIEEGLQMALQAFPTGSNRNRAIVLFSDGESLDGSPLTQAAEAGKIGIPIFPVSVGTVEGSPIVLANRQPITDEHGNIVISRLNRESLAEIARVSGGITFDITDAAIFTDLPQQIRSFRDSREESGFQLINVRRYRSFLGPALIFLALHIAVRVVRWREIF